MNWDPERESKMGYYVALTQEEADHEEERERMERETRQAEILMQIEESEARQEAMERMRELSRLLEEERMENEDLYETDPEEDMDMNGMNWSEEQEETTHWELVTMEQVSLNGFTNWRIVVNPPEFISRAISGFDVLFECQESRRFLGVMMPTWRQQREATNLTYDIAVNQSHGYLGPGQVEMTYSRESGLISILLPTQLESQSSLYHPSGNNTLKCIADTGVDLKIYVETQLNSGLESFESCVLWSFTVQPVWERLGVLWTPQMNGDADTTSHVFIPDNQTQLGSV